MTESRRIKYAETTSTILGMAHSNAKYNSRKSSVNKKWVRFLKNHKLFDEYMVYLAGHDAVGVEPKTYRHVSNMCHNMQRCTFRVKGGTVVNVDWLNVFKEFTEETIKWYNVKQKFLYMINKGYK